MNISFFNELKNLKINFKNLYTEKLFNVVMTKFTIQEN